MMDVMIAHLEGVVAGFGANFIIISAGGVGYKVYIPLATAQKLGKSIGKNAELWTHLISREMALELYGFETQEELEFFEMLVSVSGIGPKSALAILNLADVTTLKSAIASDDASYLTKVSGIGKKSSQRIIIELHDKFEIVGGDGEPSALKDELDAIEGLQSIGYSTKEARDALKTVPADIKGASERITEALKILGK